MKQEFEDAIRNKAIEIHKGECGDKQRNKKGDMNFWIGSPNETSPISTSVKNKCSECGGNCWVDEKMKEHFKLKKVKYLCGICCLENHKDELTALQLELLEEAHGSSN